MVTDTIINANLKTLKIEGQVGYYTNFLLEKFLEKLKKGEEYNMEINSFGGNTYWASKMIILMSNPAYHRCTSMFGLKNVKSAALYIYALGQNRVAYETTKFHIHRHYNEESQEIPQEITQDELNFWKTMQICTKIPLIDIQLLANANNGVGTIFGPHEAKELGIVHDIWTPGQKIFSYKSD